MVVHDQIIILTHVINKCHLPFLALTDTSDLLCSSNFDYSTVSRRLNQGQWTVILHCDSIESPVRSETFNFNKKEVWKSGRC